MSPNPLALNQAPKNPENTPVSSPLTLSLVLNPELLGNQSPSTAATATSASASPALRSTLTSIRNTKKQTRPRFRFSPLLDALLLQSTLIHKPFQQHHGMKMRKWAEVLRDLHRLQEENDMIGVDTRSVRDRFLKLMKKYETEGGDEYVRRVYECYKKCRSMGGEQEGEIIGVGDNDGDDNECGAKNSIEDCQVGGSVLQKQVENLSSSNCEGIHDVGDDVGGGGSAKTPGLHQELVLAELRQLVDLQKQSLELQERQFCQLQDDMRWKWELLKALEYKK